METNNPSIYDVLSERIKQSEKFAIYDSLQKNEILKNLNIEGVEIEELPIEDIKFLINTASIFACSSNDSYKQIAYSIAVFIHSQYHSKYEEVAKIASVLLIRLGNFPAYSLLRKDMEEEEDYFENTPISLQLETTTKSLENKVKIAEEELYLTDFQKQLFDILTAGADFSFAAPTSAGKSFLLILYIIDQLRKHDQFTIVYIVPTKALINQVKNDLRSSFRRFKFEDVKVLSSTVSFEFEDLHQEAKQNKHVLILTQERLSYLLSKQDLDFSLDTLIVDEAQKVNDGNRGVILERVIIQALGKFPNLRVVFSSPLASNPEFFQKYKQSVQNIRTNYSPVHQNVLFVNSSTQKPFLTLLDDSLTTLTENSKLQKDCPKSSDKKKLAFWAYQLGKGQSNILYANGASSTEDLANALCTYLPDISHPKIENFIDFIKDNVHSEYSLIECLRKGVVFHYSTMPREIKEKIEELFSDESVPINYLCCTSTLLEGMNLPAKNVFILKPTKGKGNKMGKFDFWNLAGRAGRLLKDFYGNIYCVDTDTWDKNGEAYIPEKSVENYAIVSATEDSLSSKSKHLSAYLENLNESFPPKERELLEQTTSTFVLNILDNSSNTVERFVSERGLEVSAPETIPKIDLSIKRIISNNQLPKDILQKNSGIDPRLQNQLYARMISQLYTIFLPKHPLSGKEFYDSLLSIYTLIDEIFFNSAERKIIARYAVLSSQWINEYPLGALIQNQIDYEKSADKFNSVDRCVRDIVDVIERTITYKYAKYLKCYHDILEHHLRTIKVEDNPINLSAYLELGAYHKTTLSLLSFGLSRTTAIRLRKIIDNDNLGRSECRKWLIQNYSKHKEKLPALCQDDFERNFE